jgi:hypothetical protein
MALRKNTENTAAPAFESEEGGAAVAEAAAPAAAPATTALEVKKEGAVTSALRRNTALDDLKGVIGPDMLESLGFGTFPRIVVSPNCFTDKSTGKILGDRIQVEVLSWNHVTLVTTGKKDDPTADKLIRSSYDGVNLTGGEGLVTEYIAKLKDDGYDKATAKVYTEIYCNLLWTSKGGFIPAEDQKITQISVPPTSSGPWGAFLLMQRMQASRGREVSSIVTVEAGSRTNGSNTFGVMEYNTKPVA